MGDTVAFFPADKHKSFLQVDSITLGVRSQTGPKYQKQPVYNIFAISQGKHDVDFCLLINSKGFIKLILHFRCMWPGMPKIPKIASLLS